MGRRIDERLWGEWRARLARYKQWTGTVAAFCAREGVTTVAFYQWRRKLGARRAVGQSSHRNGADVAPRFLPVRIERAEPVEIELPNGVRVRVPDGAGRTLETVLAAAARCDIARDGMTTAEAPAC